MNTITLPGIMMGSLAVASVSLALTGLYKSLRRTNLATAAQNKIFSITTTVVFLWMVFIGILASKGFFAHFETLPPRPLFIILLPLPVILIIAFSKNFKSVLMATPPHWLVLFQSFRIVVELLLWQASVKGLVPVQMTFEGRNFDIITGILGLLTGWILLQKKPWSRAFAIAYNFIGLALLLNILIVAVLSMPTPIRYFMNEPANTIVAQFPFIYLPAVLVVLAYSFHIFSLRQLFLKKEL